jgi:zinc/manganese transport system substrate-binding protein
MNIIYRTIFDGGCHVSASSIIAGTSNCFNNLLTLLNPAFKHRWAGWELSVIDRGRELIVRWCSRCWGFKGEAVVVSTGIDTISMEENGKAVTDPHVWNSARNVIIWANNIEKALSAASPEDAAVFRANAKGYAKQLEELDSYARDRIGAVPQEKRKVLTSHDAFGYFSRAYGVSFLSPIGLSTESEASAGDVGRLIDQIKKEGVKVYFIENSNDPRLVQQIATATGAKPGGKLYVESLSSGDGPTRTYTAMFHYNVDQIVAAISK